MYKRWCSTALSPAGLVFVAACNSPQLQLAGNRDLLQLHRQAIISQRDERLNKIRRVDVGLRWHLMVASAQHNCWVVRECCTVISQAACHIFITQQPTIWGLHRRLVVIRNSSNAEFCAALNEGECGKLRYDVWGCLSSDVLVYSGVQLKPKVCVTPQKGIPINH